MNNNKVLKNDILRYKKNKLAANLALLGLVFGVLYFMFIYGIYAEGVNNASIKAFFYKPQLGASVIINLVFLLFVFYCSEEVKAYNQKFAYVEFFIALCQIGRIFYYPVYGHMKNAMNTGLMITCIIFLALSAGCLIASGVFGITKAIAYKKHVDQIENGEIDMNVVLKELDDAENMVADATVADTAEVK